MSRYSAPVFSSTHYVPRQFLSFRPSRSSDPAAAALLSTLRGAGRVMSRTEARCKINSKPAM